MKKVAAMANRDSNPVAEIRSKSTSEVVRPYLRHNRVILGNVIECTFAIWNKI